MSITFKRIGGGKSFCFPKDLVLIVANAKSCENIRSTKGGTERNCKKRIENEGKMGSKKQDYKEDQKVGKAMPIEIDRKEEEKRLNKERERKRNHVMAEVETVNEKRQRLTSNISRPGTTVQYLAKKNPKKVPPEFADTHQTWSRDQGSRVREQTILSFAGIEWELIGGINSR